MSGLEVAAQVASLLPFGDVDGAADIDERAPRATLVRASACGTAAEPMVEVVFTSSVFPGREFTARFAEVPYGHGRLADARPDEAAQMIRLWLLEEVETGGPKHFVPDDDGVFTDQQ